MTKDHPTPDSDELDRILDNCTIALTSLTDADGAKFTSFDEVLMDIPKLIAALNANIHSVFGGTQ